MAILKLDDILAAPDIKTEKLPVPEWGGEILVRGLSGVERDAFEASVIEQKGKKTEYNMRNVRARFVALCMVDETGRRICDEENVYKLGKKSARALQRVWDKARELSGMSDEDVEELTKNSKSDQSDDSTSA